MLFFHLVLPDWFSMKSVDIPTLRNNSKNMSLKSWGTLVVSRLFYLSNFNHGSSGRLQSTINNHLGGDYQWNCILCLQTKGSQSSPGSKSGSDTSSYTTDKWHQRSGTFWHFGLDARQHQGFIPPGNRQRFMNGSALCAVVYDRNLNDSSRLKNS